jgi:hypothetical protein
MYHRGGKKAGYIMLTRNALLVRDRIYPLAQLFVGLVFVVSLIGVLGYGFLVLMGY